MIFKTSFVAAVAGFLSLASSHPGEKHDAIQEKRDAAMRHYLADENKRSLSACAGAEHVKARQERAMHRRLETFKRLRRERGLEDHVTVERRSNSDFAKWAAVSHKSTLTYNASTPDATIFASKSAGGCVLTPDNADGPYFVEQEQIRTNLVEKQVGVPVHLELQFLDVSTCKPIQNILVDTWSCNSTGVYSGVAAAGEGGLGSTYLRGVAPTDADGVVAFDTLFPGHYSGRATHIHVITHAGATQLPNGTYSGGHINHLSQLFFDQSLIDSIENTAPYNKNTIARTSNAADLFTGYAATPNYDPFPDYIQLGSDLSGGLFMWLEMAVNLSLSYDSYAPPAAWQGANGGTQGQAFANGQMPYVVVTPPPTHG